MAAAGAQARKARLVIKEMVLDNFKSYAGEQRIGPFHKVRAGAAAAAVLGAKAAVAAGAIAEAPRRPSQSFSSVVGPNGSGKSNVIDALLFVFGKRAKQARPRRPAPRSAPRPARCEAPP